MSTTFSPGEGAWLLFEIYGPIDYLNMQEVEWDLS
jgi:hypothetical protein